MLTFLEEILNGILELPYILIAGFVTVINGVILALAAIAEAALSLLPGFPEVESLPGGIVGGLLWFVPLVQLVAVMAIFISAWITFLIVKVALKWAKFL